MAWGTAIGRVLTLGAGLAEPLPHCSAEHDQFSSSHFRVCLQESRVRLRLRGCRVAARKADADSCHARGKQCTRKRNAAKQATANAKPQTLVGDG